MMVDYGQISQHNYGDMQKIFTIGFSGKSPDAFIEVLNAVRVCAVWDIRLWRASAYVPFYSGENLATVLGARYEYHPEFAPTTEILTGYKNGAISWSDYEKMYRELLVARNPTTELAPIDIDRVCLLCTEKSAVHCHRHLATEYIASQIPDIDIVHL